MQSPPIPDSEVQPRSADRPDRTPPSGRFVAELQGLRGVAVALVVIYHAWPSVLPGGYLGVDVFFVLSGFLITGLLQRELTDTGRIDFVAFYARRARRLTPAMVVVVLAVLAMSSLSFAPLERKMLTSSALATLAYVSNMWFASSAVDYMAEDSQHDLLLHTWSLSVEEQFYLIWPALIAGLAAWRPMRANRTVHGVIALSCVSFGLCLLLRPVVQPWVFFGAPTRAWEFGAGAVVALAYARAPRLPASVGLVGGLAVIVSSFGFSAHTAHPGLVTLLPVLGVCALILDAVSGARSRASSWLRWSPLQRLGDWSYSLYLWHWPILVLAREIDTAAAAAAGIVVATILAWLTYTFVEQPARHGAWLGARPARSLAALGVAVLACAAVAGSVRLTSAKAAGRPEQQRYTKAVEDVSPVTRDGCHAGYLDADLAPCIYGDARASRTIVLFGDSHAAQWFPALLPIATRHHYRLISLTKSACPPAMVESFAIPLNRPYVECDEWREQVLRRIADTRPDIVVVAAATTSRSENATEWEGGVRRMLEHIAPVTRQVVLLTDTPRADTPVPRCLARAAENPDRTGLECTIDAPDLDARTIWPSMGSGFDNVAIADVTPVVCPNFPCPTERDGAVLYHDEDHLTATFAASLTDSISDLLLERGR